MVVSRKIIKFYDYDGTFKFKLSLNEANARLKQELQTVVPSKTVSSPKKKTKKKRNIEQQTEPTKVELFLELIS